MPRKQFPRGHEALVIEGYCYLFASKCRDEECRAPLLWYRTPGGKRMPVDADKKIPHFWCCIGVQRERREKHGVHHMNRLASKQLELFPW